MIRGQHLLGMRDVPADTIYGILDTARGFKEISRRTIKKVPSLRGRTVLNVFYEASTRTRVSFELAGKRLSADGVNISASGSSTSTAAGTLSRKKCSPWQSGSGAASALGRLSPSTTLSKKLRRF